MPELPRLLFMILNRSIEVPQGNLMQSIVFVPFCENVFLNVVRFVINEATSKPREGE